MGTFVEALPNPYGGSPYGGLEVNLIASDGNIDLDDVTVNVSGSSGSAGVREGYAQFLGQVYTRLGEPVLLERQLAVLELHGRFLAVLDEGDFGH